MILVNTDYISGRELETLALVKGSTIQSKHIGKDIAQSFKTLVGGELKAYNEMMNEARALATKRMVAEAEALGADAIVNIRYASAAVMQGAAEVIVYGTAVKFIVSGVLYDIVFIVVENDVNCDGAVNGIDLIQLKKIQNGKKFGAFSEYSADINGDGEITDEDVILLTELITAQK